MLGSPLAPSWPLLPPRPHTRFGPSESSEVALGDQSPLQGILGQPHALLILRELIQLELGEQCTQIRLDRVHAQEHLFGDLLVGRRCDKAPAGLIWTTQ